MKDLMKRILESRDVGLVDAVLRESNLVLQMEDGRILTYAGNGMAKGNDGLEDLRIDYVESISVGEPPVVPTPVLSTEERPNGIDPNINAPSPADGAPELQGGATSSDASASAGLANAEGAAGEDSKIKAKAEGGSAKAEAPKKPLF